MENLIIRMVDIRASKLCSRGARTFFERHGLDWNDFLKNGIDSRALLNTEDAMAIKVVEVARGRK